jgi:hypothetical protein
MPAQIRCLIILLLCSTLHGVAQQRNGLAGSGPQLSGGIAIGYDLGMPVQVQLMLSDFLESLPLAMRFSVGHSFMLDAGRPDEARRVFINENDNGVPSKHATRWEFGCDLMHHVNVLSLRKSFVHAGVRYSRFTSTFEFIGGNEIFDVHANQFGLSAGWDGYFPASARLDLVLTAGVEYFFRSTLEGHDAAYSPDGEMVNQREEYTYADADHAINQPHVQPVILIGLNYHF